MKFVKFVELSGQKKKRGQKNMDDYYWSHYLVARQFLRMKKLIGMTQTTD